MRDFLRRSGIGLLALSMGLVFLLYGICRSEPQTVLNKSSIVCLECIGIG